MPRDARQENGINRIAAARTFDITLQLTSWQRLRTRLFLFSVGVKRRITLGTRAALIDGDRVFLIRQTYLPGWQFCGGGVMETGGQLARQAQLDVTRIQPARGDFGLERGVDAGTTAEQGKRGEESQGESHGETLGGCRMADKRGRSLPGDIVQSRDGVGPALLTWREADLRKSWSGALEQRRSLAARGEAAATQERCRPSIRG